MRLRWAAVGLAVALLAGCSGGDDDDASASADASTTTEPSATTAAAQTTTTVPPPLYSFDGSVPAPELNITGDDFDAIYRSLSTYLGWLYAHSPDVSLIAEIAVSGSPQEESITDDVEDLVDLDLRLYDVEEVESIEVVDSTPTAATLRITYTTGQTFIVERDGTVREEGHFDGLVQVVLLAPDAAGRWKLSSVSTAPPDDVAVDS